jgi:WD40 repeat protein
VLSVALGTLEGRPVIVSSGNDSTVRVWDLTTGAPRAKALHGHVGCVQSIALGILEGRPLIVSAGDDGTIRVWDMTTGAPRGEPWRGHADQVNSIALGTLEGQQVIVSGGGDGTVRVWDLAGFERDRVDVGFFIDAVAIAENGFVVTAGTQGLVVIQFHGR